MAKLNLALIGLGSWGANHLKTIKKIPEARLKYVCTRDYQKLFQKNDIDGVIIATPAATHYQIAVDFLKRNFNLLIEKPLTSNYQEALKLRKIYKQSSSLLMVGHVFQYHPAYLKAKEIAKKIGPIRYLDFEGTDYGPFRNDISALWDWAPHDLEMCLGVLEKMPLEVAAWSMSKLRPGSKLDDLVMLRLNFEKNISVWMKMGWLSPIKRRRMTIVGQKSAVVFDDLLEKKVIFFQNFGPRVRKNRVFETKAKISYPDYSLIMPLAAELQEFIRCLRTKKQPKTSFDQALRVLKIIDRVEQSLNQGGKVIKL